MKIRNIYILFAILILASCHDDLANESENTIITTEITVPYIYSEIDGTLVGYVYEDVNTPVSGAEVSIYSATTTTDEFGVFEMANVKLDVQGTYIQVSKSGYINGSDYVYPNDNGSGASRLKMRKLSHNGDMLSSEGGQLIFAAEGEVTFLPNSVVLENGSSYNGQVSIEILEAGLNNEDNNDFEGGFIGLDELGRNRVLGSYGSVSVSLFGTDNQLLNIKSGETYTIKFPIRADLLSDASDEVNVWLYDDVTGQWVEDGTATKNGNFYIYEAEHVGIFMFGISYPTAQFCGRLVDSDELPLINCWFNVYADGRICASGLSDNDGFICSRLPNNERLQLQIIHPFCNEEIALTDIDPINDVVNVGDVKIDMVNDLRTGTVLCNGAAVPNALIIIKDERNTMVQITNDDGAFSINLSNIVCDEEGEFSLFAISGSDLSPTINMSIDNTENLQLEVCEAECAFLVSILKSKADFCTSGIYDTYQVITEGGSGEFTYVWDDGTVGAVNNSITSDGESCITVKDIASGCEVLVCEEPSDYDRLSIVELSAYHISCEQDGGRIDPIVTGGVEPYDFIWSGEGGFVSNEENLSDLFSGLYTVTVIDANGCEEVLEQSVFDVNVPLTSDIIEYCDYSIIQIKEDIGYTPYIYKWSNGFSETNELEVFQSGEYSVTVTDAIGCQRSKSVEIFSVGQELELDVLYVCEGKDVVFNPLSQDYDYFYESISDGIRTYISIEEGKLEVSILESGYRFLFGGVDLVTSCEKSELIDLPHFEGLEIAFTNTSCEECNDGFISVFLDNNQNCTGGCVTGEVIIIDKLTSEDVTEQNVSSQLSSGIYVVIVTDENNGCYIAHEEVEIK